MPATLLDAKAKLEAEGLHVSCNDPHSLWIAATLRDAGAGIQVSQDACTLGWKSGRWVAVFPAEGLLTYEVPDSLPELVRLVTAVYANYRQAGGRFKDAFARVVPDAERFLISRSPAHV
jgi:hypothetical protein